MIPPLPILCIFCGVAPSRAGDLYCCDGCGVLHRLETGTETAETPLTPEDATFIRTFGQDEGSTFLFECYVDPLACEACLQGLTRLQTLVPQVRDLQWNRTSSVLGFRFLKEDARPARVFAVLESLHLSPRWKSGGEIAPARAQRDRTLRLGVTAALAGNLMLFSVPIYAGLAGSLQTLFEYIQSLIFLPVLVWSALPIFRTALASLRLRQLSVDLPLTIAFLAGAGFSYLSLFRGGHDIYFDSLAGFLLLILWSRSLLESSLVKYLESPTLERFFETPVFHVQRGGEPFWLSWKELRPGDEIELKIGDRVPTDGVLMSDAAQIENAWMTGEKAPLWRLRGATVQAGVRLLSKEARLKVEKPAEDSEFARLLRRIGPASEKIAARFEARLGSALVIACFAAIAALFLFAGTLGFDELARRGVSLLIVACPCAVSFAAPLARAKASQIAFKHGFWVRNPAAWDRLLGLRRIAFDKTGTLTGGLFAMSPQSPMIDRHWKQVILTLENVSQHPIAESLRRAWGALPLLPIEDAREIPGRGVQGKIGGALYEIRGTEDAGGLLELALHRDGDLVAHLVLQDEAGPTTEKALRRLRLHYELFIVSGDRRSRVDAFGERYGFEKSRLFGGLTPDEKVRVLSEIQPDVYIGDGTNDIPALRSAPVSITVQAASLEARAASDVLMLAGDLARCEDLFAIAEATRRLNRRNLAFALSYNLLAGAAACAGLIQPLLAAVLMPVSSFVLLASTLRGTKELRRLARTP